MRFVCFVSENGKKCAHNLNTGECNCKIGVMGEKCTFCRKGYYGFGEDPDTGCKSKTEPTLE